MGGKKKWPLALLTLTAQTWLGAQGLRLEQVCLNPLGNADSMQWVSLVNPAGQNEVALTNLIYRVNNRRRGIFPMGSRDLPRGAASPRVLLGGQTLLLIEKVPVEMWGQTLNGLQVATLDSASLGDGTALAPGDQLAIEGPGTLGEEITLQITPPGHAFERRFPVGQSPWVISRDLAIPGRAETVDPNAVAGSPEWLAPTRVLSWVWGRPLVVLWELQDENGNPAWAHGGLVRVSGKGNVHAVPLDQSLRALRTEAPVSWPLLWGQAPPVRVQSFDRGRQYFFFNFEGQTFPVAMYFGGFDSPWHGQVFISEVRPGSLQSPAFVELTGAIPPGTAFTLLLTSDDLTYEKRVPIVWGGGPAQLICPAPFADSPCPQTVNPNASAYAEGTLTLVDPQDRTIDVAHYRKGDHDLGPSGSLHRRFPQSPAIDPGDWVASRTAWLPSPGIPQAPVAEGRGAVVFAGPQTWTRQGPNPPCSLTVASLCRTGARLWQREGEAGPTLWEGETAGPGSPLPLNPDFILKKHPGLKGALVLVVEGTDSVSGKSWRHRVPLWVDP